MSSKFAIANDLSDEQENIVCRIQAATYDKDIVFLSMLPEEVLEIANIAQTFWFNKNDKAGVQEDIKLANIVKKYWDKNGDAIPQTV